MRLRHELIPVLLALAAFDAAPSPGETYWSTTGGGLSAFELDPVTHGTTLTMQMAGRGSLGPFPYFGVATDPGTGELWVTFRDALQSVEGVGRLRPGSIQPEAVVVLPFPYTFSSPHPTFASDGRLYLQVYSSTTGLHGLVRADLASAEFETVLSFAEGELLSGIAFEGASGKLHLAGSESCGGTCRLAYVDTLTTPQHQRHRIVSGDFGPGELLFTPNGDLLLMNPYFHLVQSGALEPWAFPPYMRTPFGSLFRELDQASAAVENTPGCMPSPTRGCLQHRRFALDVTFDATDHGGPVGTATTQLESDESLKFYFFAAENLEVFVKILEGCGVNDHYWIFASGLTNLGVSVRVTDTRTGAVYTHDNPRGQTFAPLLDILAFPCNP